MPNLAHLVHMNCLNATRPLNRTKDSLTQRSFQDCKPRHNTHKSDLQMPEFCVGSLLGSVASKQSLSAKCRKRNRSRKRSLAIVSPKMLVLYTKSIDQYMASLGLCTMPINTVKPRNASISFFPLVSRCLQVSGEALGLHFTVYTALHIGLFQPPTNPVCHL